MTDDVKTIDIPMPDGGGTLTVPVELADQIQFLDLPANDGLPVPPTGLTVLQRLIMCSADLGAVGKDRDANAGGGDKYKFRGYDAVVNATHPVFAKWGVLVTYQDLEFVVNDKVPRGQSKWTYFLLKVEWTFHGWDGDTFVIVNHGEGLDNADKGLGKARSYALKDVLTRVLTMPTDDPTTDAEATSVPDEADYHGGGNPPPPPERNPAEDEAIAAGFESLKDRDDQHAGVVSFITEHVHDAHHIDQLRSMRSPWPMGSAALAMFKQTAMRLASKEQDDAPPAGVDADGVVDPEVSDDPDDAASGPTDIPPNGVVTSEHIRLARNLAPDEADDTMVGTIAQGLADDPDLYRQALDREEADAIGADGQDERGPDGTPAEFEVVDISDTALAGYDKPTLEKALRERGHKVSGPMAEQRARLRAWRDDDPVST